MDQNPQSPNTDTSQTPAQPGTDAQKPPEPQTPPMQQPMPPAVEPQPVTAPAPQADPIPTPPSTPPPSQPQPEHSSGGGSMPKGSNKKTIAVAAAGISVMLVVLGVYAMSQESFNTQSKQEAASKTVVQKPTPSVPTLTPTPSDVVEQDLGAIENELKNADKEASMADQGLSATPPDLQ